MVWKYCWVWARSNRCCQHHMTGKQRVATAVFSQHHHDKMVQHHFVLFQLPPAIFWTLCLSWQFAWFITYHFTRMPVRPRSGCIRNAQCSTADAVFPTCVILHVQIIYCLVLVGHGTYMSGVMYDVISGLMTSYPWQIDTAQLWTVWGLHVSTIKWGSLTLTQLTPKVGLSHRVLSLSNKGIQDIPQ